MIFCILLRRHLLHLCRCVDDAQDEDGGSDVERIDHRVGHYALCSHVAYAEEREQEREHISHQRAGVAQKALYRVGQGFLLLVHHVAHEHLERLHGHVDARVEKHQRDKTEHHGRADSHAERAGVGQQAHDEYGHQCADKQIRYAPAEAAPRLVAQRAHYRLHDDAHKRRQYPKVAKIVRVGPQRCENSADVGALQCVGNLHAEEAEAQIPERCETQVGFLLQVRTHSLRRLFLFMLLYACCCRG